jgi:hypothetical protein
MHLSQIPLGDASMHSAMVSMFVIAGISHGGSREATRHARTHRFQEVLSLAVSHLLDRPLKRMKFQNLSILPPVSESACSFFATGQGGNIVGRALLILFGSSPIQNTRCLKYLKHGRILCNSGLRTLPILQAGLKGDLSRQFG